MQTDLVILVILWYPSIISSINGLRLGHYNREDFWEIPESIIGKFSSIIDADLYRKREETDHFITVS